MTDNATVIGGQDNLDLLLNSFRPLVKDARTGRMVLSGVTVNEKTGEVSRTDGPIVNSMLREDEWKQTDAAVIEAARYPLVGIDDLRARGLVKPIGSLGVLIDQWYASSELTPAEQNMTGRSRGSRDLPDMVQFGVPLPFTFKEFGVDLRMLEASRRFGSPIDTTTAAEAGRVVAETLAAMLFGGSSVTFQGRTIYGYRTHPNRVTDTASNFGGGDWGTIANIHPTVAGMLTAATGQRAYGPKVLYISETQYDQAAYAIYSDGTGESALERMRKNFTEITAFRKVPAEILPAGELVLIELAPDVVQWAETLGIQAREWRSPDGMEASFKVITVAAPEVKARYDGKSGIVHATAA